MSGFKTKLEGLINKIDDAVTDFTTLDVLTISGDVKTVISKDGKYLKPIDLVKGYDAKTSTVIIEAYTHIDFDQDVIQFYRDGITVNDLSYELHQDAVESSKAARLAVLSFIKEMIG